MNTPIKIFGHQGPDTDTVVSAIAYAWYYNNVKGQPATPHVLGDLNKETLYVLDRFGIEIPEKIDDVEETDTVIIVDTNNPKELPEKLLDAEILEIIDHHKLTGGITTSKPLSITMRPMASTASLIYTIMNPELHPLPAEIAGIMLAALLSDTLEFRSPTTTDEDRQIGDALAKIAGVDIHELATAMFEAKSDVSDLDPEDILTMDSKVFDIHGVNTRVSVVETTNPQQIVDRQPELQTTMTQHVADTADVDEVLLFVIDIFESVAIPIVASERGHNVVNAAFGVDSNETPALPGVVSRKKQIIPQLMATDPSVWQ